MLCSAGAPSSRGRSDRGVRAELGALGVEDHARGDQAAGDVGVAQDAQGDAVRGLQVAGQDVPDAGHAGQDEPGEQDERDARPQMAAHEADAALDRRERAGVGTKIASTAKEQVDRREQQRAPSTSTLPSTATGGETSAVKPISSTTGSPSSSAVPSRTPTRPSTSTHGARRAAPGGQRPAARAAAGAGQAAVEPAAQQQAQARQAPSSARPSPQPLTNASSSVARWATRPGWAGRSGPRPAAPGR